MFTSLWKRPLSFLILAVIAVMALASLKAGTLTGTYQSLPQFSVVNLSQIGAVDWIHWGTYTEYAFDRKAAVPPVISNYKLLGNPIADFGPFQYGDNYNGYTWNDGMQEQTATNSTTGIYLLGKGDGYQITVPADTTTRVLKVYVGAYGAGGTFSASLSDGGTYSSTAVSYLANGPAGLYTLTYTAASSNQTLTAKFTLSTLRDRNYGNVTLQAAALYYAVSNNPPTATITSPTPNATFSVGDAIPISASAFDRDGTISNVQFFSGSDLIGQSSGTPYTLTWSNAPPGHYLLTAHVTDNNGASYTTRCVTVFVTGMNGLLNGNVAHTSSNVVLSVEGSRDWTHWGLNNPTSFDQKAGVAPFLPNFQSIGTGAVQQLTQDITLWSWSGGTPHSTATDSSTGVYVIGFTNGFELQLPANTNRRTATVDVGVYSARGEIQAFLSDFSAPAFADTSQRRLYGRASGVYTFNYAAGSDNQKLILRYTASSLYDFDFGSVTLLSSSALAGQPSVDILTPTNGAVLNASGGILIQANAFNPDGPIESVTFYDDGIPIGQVSNAPFRVFWNDASPGIVNLQAIALDVFGTVATSAPVSLTLITNPPSPVRLISPVAGHAFVAGTNITLEAVVNSSFDAQSVEFFVGDASLGQVFGPPFSLVWSNVSVGLYTLSAVATDLSGVKTNSLAVTIAVDPNKPPSVVLSTPANGSVFHLSAPVTITAAASDSDGFISLIEIFDGATKLAECADSSCMFVLSNSASQVYSLTARASDNWLSKSTSAPVVVTITNLPPMIAITNPINGASVWTATPITIGAAATDPDGAIQRVQFYEGTSLIGEAESAPFSIVWSNVTAGIFTLSAVATDNDGATSSSLPVSITVSNPAPSIAITNPAPNVAFARHTNITFETRTEDLNGTVTNVSFWEGTNLLGNVSSAPFSFIWTNVAPGKYVLTALASDNEGAVTVSDPVSIVVLNSSLTGDVFGSFEVVPENSEVNLSEEGAIDWIHWGTYTEFASDRKAGVTPFINEFSLLGDPFPGEGPFQFSDNYNGYTWWDGRPNPTIINTTSGIYVSGLDHGFQLTVPSDMTTRVLKVYVGAYAAEATFSAYLSDGSGYFSTDINYLTNGPAGVYTISYISASSNQLLTVKYFINALNNPEFGNITLQAAAVSYATENNPPTIAITEPARTTTYSKGDSILLTAIASDRDGTITNIEFYAGTNRLGHSSDIPGVITWTNAELGHYVITAQATDNNGATSSSLPVGVFVTGTNGFLAGDGATTASAVDLSAEGTRDWAHWGNGGVSSFDHKAGVPVFLPNFQKIGTNAVQAVDDITSWTWTGGTPTSSASNSTTGVSMSGYTNGFQLQLPASTNSRIARVYVGLFSARGRMEAFLSDYSAPVFTDTSLASFSGGVSKVFTFDYAAASNNQKLIVRFTADSIFDFTQGSVSLLSASAVVAQSSVVITAPTDGSEVNCSHPPQIQVSATNVDGAIASVSFYQESTFIGRVTNTPFSLTWSNAVPGSYSLTASATDMYGITVASDPIRVTLIGNPLPSITLTDPAESSVFFEHTNVTIEAEASDLNGNVTAVEFFAGTNSLGQANAFPFNIVWSNVAPGSYALTAVATDDQGDSTISVAVNAVVVTNKWPLVRILSPTNNASFFTTSNVWITATASDVDGQVTLLELFDGQQKLTESTNTNLAFAWTNPTAGTHFLTARATDNWFGTNTSTPIAITITNPAPSVAITNPVDRSIFLEMTNIAIRAQASDSNGLVSAVELFANTNSLGIMTNAPFTLIWTNAALGSYTLTAIATDNEGATAISKPVIITVVTNTFPVVSIATPTNGAIFFTSSNITVTANASDSDGTITLIELFDGAIKLAEASNSSLNFVLTNVTPGAHLLTALATDNWLGTNTSSVIVTVTNPPPFIAITNPPSGAVIIEHTNLLIRTTSSDTNGTVVAVEFFANTNSLGVMTNAPFTLAWTNAVLGSYSFTAIATDNEGASAVSAPVNITVVTNQLPTVSISAPTNGATFFSSSDFIVRADASDSDGAISLIELFEGGIKLAESSNSSFSFPFTNASSGSHTFMVRATDNWFGTNGSATVTVTVTNPPPTIAITNPIDGIAIIEHTNLIIRAKSSDTNGTVVAVEFFANTDSLGVMTNAPFTVVWSNAAIGPYSLTAVATDNEGASAVSPPININVVSNQLPNASLTAPTNGAIFFFSSNFTITANASDADGFITLLELFDGPTKLAESSNSSLSVDLTNASAGIHTLIARTTDNWFGTNTSPPVTVTVTDPPPSIALAIPVEGSLFVERTNIAILASADAPNRTIAMVEFFANTNSLGFVTNAPFSLVWSNVAFGTYSLMAIVTDDRGATAISAPVTVTVLTNKLPTVGISAPTNGATFFTSSNFAITANSSDLDGSIALLELFDGAVKLAESSNSSFSFVLTNASTGTHLLTARATDNLFGTNTSPAVVVSITNPPPSIAVTNPLAGTTFFEHTNITLRAKASDTNGSVARVEFFANTNSLGFVTNSPFSIVWSNIASGSYSLTAIATDNEGATAASAPVNVIVLTNKLPIVTITAPTNGATFFTSSNFTMTASASDPDGAIQLLELFDGPAKLGQSSNSSLSFVLTNASAGTHLLTARATDNLLGTNTSSAVLVTITNPPPSIAITNPLAGATFFEHTNITVRAKASDTNGTVTRVEFFADTNSLGFLTNSPFSIVWSNVTSGSYSVTAVATDNGGATAMSTPVNVTVLTNKLPLVAVTAPTNGAIFFTSSNFTMTASASDPDGSITLLELFDGVVKLAQSSNSSLSFVLTNASAGTHPLTARATDNLSGTNTSSAVLVTVTNPPPSIVITNPLAGATFFEHTNITIRAKASDTNGTVTRVEFFADTNSLGFLTNSPFSIVWSNVTSGSYSVTAVATDNGGATAMSTPVNVTVLTNKLPIVIVTAPTNGSTFYSLSNITVSVVASDPDGNITLLELFDGATRFNQSSNSSLSVALTNVAAGTHILTARATDNWFGTNTSAAVTVTVFSNLPPTVSITTPTNGAQFLSSSNITISATASGHNEKIKLLELFDGPTKLSQTTNGLMTFLWTNAVIGQHSLTARATDSQSSSSTSIPVAITVSNPPPSVTITAPVTGAVFIESSNVVIMAQASDVNGTVSKVEFFADSARLGQITVSPFNYTWTNAIAGNHVLSAWATDNNGASNVSVAINITVTNPAPLVAITNPPDGSLFLPNSDIEIKARASDSNGTVAKVEFFEGTNRLGQATNSPYNCIWTNVPVGNYGLTAMATDNGGRTGTSAIINIIVSSNSLPLARISAPDDGAVFVAPTSVIITASGSDSDGVITLLEIFESTNRLAQSTNSLITFVWTNAAVGFHTLTVRATDNRAGLATSSGVVINISNPPPSITITNPANNAAFLAKNRIMIQAQADDENGTVTEVQFYAGTQLLGTVSSPFNYIWTNSQIGSYLLTAVATDNDGATNQSHGVSITIVKDSPGIRESSGSEGSRNFDFPVNTESNLVYTIEFNGTIDATNWQTLTNFLGTGENILVSDPVTTNQHRFYRINTGGP